MLEICRRDQWTAVRRAFGTALLLMGCASDWNGSHADGEVADTESVEDTQTLAEALDGSDACANVTAHKSFDEYFPTTEYISTPNYNPGQCSRGFRIDILTARFPADTWNIVEDGDTLPTRRSDCERVRFGAYVWQQVGTRQTYLGGKWAWGEWKNGACKVPGFALERDFKVESIGNVKVAVSSRLYDTALDASTAFTTRKVRAQRFVAPVKNFAPGTAFCQSRSFIFDKLSTYRGRAVAYYNLYRDNVRVARLGQVADQGINIKDLWFVPNRSAAQYYTLAAETDLGEESPPTWALTDQLHCEAQDSIDRIAIVPIVPDALASSHVVSKERIEELIHGDGGSGPSLDGYFAETSHGLWQPEIWVMDPVPLKNPIEHYKALRDGVTLTRAPSWLPACSNDFSCGCIRGQLPGCACNDSDPSKVKVSCPNYASTTQEDEAIFSAMRNFYPPLRGKTLFASVFMGVPGGGTGREGEPSLSVGGDDLLPINSRGENVSFGDAMGVLVHEIGHAIGLHHAASFEATDNGLCDVSDQLLFGSDPLKVGDCSPFVYGDLVDAMAAGLFRQYGNYSQWVLGWHDNVKTINPMKDGATSWTGSLYGDPTAGTGLVRLLLDEAGSSIYLEYRAEDGYNDHAFTGVTSWRKPGVYAQFRPGKQKQGLQVCASGQVSGCFSTPVQTFTKYLQSPIVVGDPVALEGLYGFAIQVTRMTSTKVDYKVTRR